VGTNENCERQVAGIVGFLAIRGNIFGLTADLLNMGFWSDVRYALRVLGKSPGFATVAVLALAFGIGVNSAILTLLNAVALRPLPIRDAGAVLTLYQRIKGLKSRNVHGSKSYFSYPEYLAYRNQNQVFSGLAAYAVMNLTLAAQRRARFRDISPHATILKVMTGPLAMGRGFCRKIAPRRAAIQWWF
jgi:hypothetical protein